MKTMETKEKLVAAAAEIRKKLAEPRNRAMAGVTRQHGKKATPELDAFPA